MLMLLAALAAVPALAATSAAPPPDRATVAEITRLETRWGEAFVSRDFAFLESIIAPEFSLAVAMPTGDVIFTRRAEWMPHARAWVHEGFDARVIDVTTAGDTAVATVEGLWTVRRDPAKPADPVRFVVTDTWVKRHDQWQVVWRYSHRLPGAPWPMLPPGK